ncbi:DUF3592 domain-containing protein [Rhizorhabdus argentea]|uniref:DUF3592 domain-containing protein n=1 Tax=Rhizorhabdus argentea TaxID=1387174 RepID=UPI0030ED09E7
MSTAQPQSEPAPQFSGRPEAVQSGWLAHLRKRKAAYVVAALVVILTHGAAYLHRRHNVAILTDGGRAAAQITKFKVTRKNTCHLTYQFRGPDGRTIVNHSRKCPEGEARRVGGTIAVAYDRKDPAKNFPVGANLWHPAAPLLISLDCIILLILYVVLA